MIDAACPWCGRTYVPRNAQSGRGRRGGKAQTFCGGKCRTAYQTAQKQFVAAMVAEGVLSIPRLSAWAARPETTSQSTRSFLRSATEATAEGTEP